MKTKPKIKCNCQICDKEFISYKCEKRKFCSHSCHYQSLITLNKNKKCIYCKKDFISTKASKKEILTNYYCSRKCCYLNKKKGTYKKCLRCEKEFYAVRAYPKRQFCCSDCSYKYRKGKYNPNWSISRAKLIADGKINPKRNFYKQGWYFTKDGNKEWFGSSYEEKRMKQLDKMKVKWTKNHGIRIPYTDNNGKKRNYVPDFLINGKIIEEVKPKNLVNSKMDNNLLKHQSAIKFCKENGYEFKIITEKELNIIT